jgi:hypothetical protein
MVEFLGGIKEYKMRKWKYSADDYKACADEGLTLSETAKRMGVSRQAVHSVAAKNNITFTKKDGRGTPVVKEVLVLRHQGKYEQ